MARALAGQVVLSLGAFLASMIGPTPAFGRLESIEWGLLREAYDLIVDARFEESDALLRRSAGRAPPEVVQVLSSVGLWWRIQLDPDDRSFDQQFLTRINEAIAAADRWTTREPSRAEAWLFQGGAYGARVQWRVARQQRLAAARDGKRIKDSLERALALDPTLQDAYFGIGLYHYYADVAPTAAKILRWLLLLPGGDRQLGLQEMTQARDRGRIIRGEADYQLHIVYLWYEHRPDKALDLLKSLRTRYPHNPHFLERIAVVYDTYFHDPARSLEAYQTLLDLANAHTVAVPALARGVARLGLASQLDALYETDLAIDHLRALIASRAETPYAALARAQLQLGLAFDRMGQPVAADEAFRAAIAAAPSPDPFDIRGRVRSALGNRPDPRKAEACRLSIEGARLLERHRIDEADRALRRSYELNSADPVTWFRRGRLFAQQQRPREALAEFERVIHARPAVPPTFLAAAFFESARLIERTDVAKAVERYRAASGVAGAHRRTRDDAIAALERLDVAHDRPR